MPRCGATFDENSVPPWTRGDFRGVLKSETHPGASRHPSDGGDFQRRRVRPEHSRKSPRHSFQLAEGSTPVPTWNIDTFSYQSRHVCATRRLVLPRATPQSAMALARRNSNADTTHSMAKTAFKPKTGAIPGWNGGWGELGSISRSCQPAFQITSAITGTNI